MAKTLVDMLGGQENARAAAYGLQGGSSIGGGLASLIGSLDTASLLRASAKGEAASIRRAARRQVGQATSGIASSGFAIDTGTPLDVLTEIGAELELSAMMAEYQGNLAARNARNQGIVNAVGGITSGLGSILIGATNPNPSDFPGVED